MKLNPNEPIATVISEQLGQTIYNGLDIRAHMAIEFAKALLGTIDANNPEFAPNLNNVSYCVGLGIKAADELIKQLNTEQ